MITRINSTSSFQGQGHYINLTTGTLKPCRISSESQMALVTKLSQSIETVPGLTHKGRFKLSIEPSGVKFQKGGNVDVFLHQGNCITVEHKPLLGTTVVKEIKPQELTSVSVNASDKASLRESIDTFVEQIFKLAKSTDVLEGTQK